MGRLRKRVGQLLENLRGGKKARTDNGSDKENSRPECWGYSKRVYRNSPPSSRECDLERNVLAALGSVPLKSMRRFQTRSLRFCDAYDKGLDGKQAARAARKYKGHRTLPPSWKTDLEEAGISRFDGTTGVHA